MRRASSGQLNTLQTVVSSFHYTHSEVRVKAKPHG